jgi:cystathionine beta-lyase/cystathionine gamma-synthase
MSGTPKLGTLLLHADDEFVKEDAVAPSISVTSTFRAIPYDGELPEKIDNVQDRHVYSRYTSPIYARVEAVLSRLCNGHAVTFMSGLAATYSAVVLYQPKRIAITEGYHGVHAAFQIFQRNTGNSIKFIGLDEPYQPGDLCWVETPLNPKGEARNIKYYADKIHAVGGKLLVDATFAPPPLQDPFKWGADCIMHSGTKYLGGHSDLLCGVLVVQNKEDREKLWHDRTYMGNVMGSLESFLLLRSLRTLHLRVPRQSQTGGALCKWLYKISTIPEGQEWDGVPGGIVKEVYGAALQTEEWVKEQLSGGPPATFSILLTNNACAKWLPHNLSYFTPATSLGGVESLIEQRRMSDPGEDPRLIRISVGVEDLEDLKQDLRNGFKQIKKHLVGGAKL